MVVATTLMNPVGGTNQSVSSYQTWLAGSSTEFRENGFPIRHVEKLEPAPMAILAPRHRA